MATKDSGMSREEKIFMVQCLLQDIRSNWMDDVEDRAEMAKDLCEELGEEEFLTLASECAEFLTMDPVSRDGRYFREEFPYGYENMDKLHNLSHTLADKSDEFKKLADLYITCPECRFEDAEERDLE